MEAKFFKEIVKKKMDVKTLKDCEREIRTEINHELEAGRKTNGNLFRILLASESELWERIRNRGCSWRKLTEDIKVRLFKLIEIYSNFQNLVEKVKSLNTKVEKIKQLKDGSDGDSD